MQQISIGYQLYSAREDVKKDMNGVLEKLKAMGYDGVEFAGFFQHSAQDVRAMLDRHGLAGVSSHVPVQQIEEDMFSVLAFHRAIGCRYIAVPYLDEAHRPGAPGFAHMIRLIHRFGRLCREAGIQLLYHNHDFEFVPLSGMYGLDFLYEAVPEDLLQTELDTCWVKFAGEDPAAYLRKYAGRAPVVHLKDFVGSKGQGTPYALIGQSKQADETAFEYRPFGYGCQDAQAVVQAGIDAGAQWLIVEQDQPHQKPALEEAQMSIHTLFDLGLKRR